MRIWLERLTGLGPRVDNSAPLAETRFVVLDTELTSLDTKVNRILSVGAVEMQGSCIRLGSEFYRMMNPGVEVPERTILVHGLRPADVQNGEDPVPVMRDLAAFVGDAVLVGHFVGIDIAALKKEFAHADIKLRNVAIDTARVFRWLELGRRTYGEATDDRHEALDLHTIAQRFNVPTGDAHHALADAYVTAQVWQRLLHLLEEKAIRTIGQLRRIA